MATAAEMVSAIKTALASTPATTVEIEIDGQRVKYDRKQALEEVRFWEREAAKEAGTRPRVASIKLTGF